MPQNTALWLPARRAAFAVGPAPYTPPGAGEIVVRVRAVATNPIDWILQAVGDIIFPWLRYPAVLGSDVAGEVVEVGAGVTRFGVGDRVLGQTVGSAKGRNAATEGGFQLYAVLLADLTAAVPASLPFEAAAVLPLGVSTAAAGLFQSDFLALAPPSTQPRPTGEAVLVWGAATSVGSNAVQLATAAGYEVVATASPANFDYVRRLGATQVLDRRKPSAVKEAIAALCGRRLAGAMAVGEGSAAACVRIVGVCEGRRVVAMATPPAKLDDVPAGPGRLRALVPALAGMAAGNLSLALRARSGGVQTRFVNASSIRDNAVGPMIFAQFLPQALAEGRYLAAPEPEVVGRGLESIPAAIARHRRGVSARKPVVLL